MKWFCAASSLVAALFFLQNNALANGRFPSAGHVEVDPADPSHIVLRATYGLVVTRDGGERWNWICEGAMSYSGIWDPPIGIVTGGGVLVGLPDGLSVSTPDGCNFSRSTTIEGNFVADIAVDKKNSSRAVVLISNPLATKMDTRLFLTENGGTTFEQLGDVFPDNFRGLTVDLAPSDPQVIYVSGMLVGAMPVGAVLSSTDGGVSYSSSIVPNTDGEHAPFIAAVDPNDAKRLYVRNDGLPGQLFVSEDSGQSWQNLFTGEGSLLAFALAPDGKTLVVGGEKDGVWRSDVGSWAFEQASTLHARCLRWADAGIFACTEQVVEGYAVGLSVTNGSTFGPLSKLSDLCGPVECPESSVTGSICVAQWPTLRDTINASSCLTSTSSSSSGTGGGNSMDDSPKVMGSCTCRTAHQDNRSSASILALSLCVLASRMRKRFKV